MPLFHFYTLYNENDKGYESWNHIVIDIAVMYSELMHAFACLLLMHVKWFSVLTDVDEFHTASHRMNIMQISIINHQ